MAAPLYDTDTGPDLQKEEVHNHGKGQQVSSRAFRCGCKGSGCLYTTAHHLKVHEHAHTGGWPYTCDPAAAADRD